MKNKTGLRFRSTRKIVHFVEAQSQRNKLLLLCAVLLALVVFFLTLDRISAHFSVVVPASGGSITEGVVGFPRVINPIYAETDSEQDAAALIYAGLMKLSRDGFAPDLAESVTVADNGQTYIASIRDEAVFHDGEPVTAEDVVFTINEIQDPKSESPLQSNWSGVTVEALGTHTVRFSLDNPYTFFRENLTVGIVPKHIWEGVPSDSLTFLERGSYPVGAGPYEISDIERNELGVISSLTLGSSDTYIDGAGYIDAITLSFFETRNDLLDALDEGIIDSGAHLSPSVLSERYAHDENFTIHTAPMPRSFGLFWNQNQNQIFVDRVVRRALAHAVDKETLVEEIFAGYADPLVGPLPPHAQNDLGVEVGTPTYDPTQARELLTGDGWEENSEGILEKDDAQLSFTITTADLPELKKTAEFLESSFENIGADVAVEAVDTDTLSRDHIRPREYETLLFGLAFNHSYDLTPFFHSSNSDDPGLNIAHYTNPEVDGALETLQETNESSVQQDALETALNEIHNDYAALFLYSPQFTYTTTSNIRGIQMPHVSAGHERFSSVTEWFVNTDRVFTIFNR